MPLYCLTQELFVALCICIYITANFENILVLRTVTIMHQHLKFLWFQTLRRFVTRVYCLTGFFMPCILVIGTYIHIIRFATFSYVQRATPCLYTRLNVLSSSLVCDLFEVGISTEVPIYLFT